MEEYHYIYIIGRVEQKTQGCIILRLYIPAFFYVTIIENQNRDFCEDMM